MKTAVATVTFLLMLGAVACQEPMESISEVTKFRVLGVQAEPPEIMPGQGTTLKVLFADPKGEGRDVTIAWLNCVGSFSPTSDLSEGCEPVWAPAVSLASQGGDTYEIPMTPPDILSDLPGDEEYLTVTVVTVLCAGGELALSDAEGEAPTGEIDALDDLCEGGDGLVAIKAFRISTSSNPNTNPTIALLKFNDAPLAEISDGPDADAGAPDAGGEQSGIYVCENSYGCMEGAPIQAFLTDESFQQYEKEEFGEIQVADENPYISWFVTGGKFSEDRSRTNEAPGPFEVDWKPPRYGGVYELWAVVHDMRGGLSWRSYSVEAQVPEL